MLKLKRLSCALCFRIRDEGLCILISSSDSIELIECNYCALITNNLVECAIMATKLRRNGIVLKLDVRGTSVISENINEESPLLELLLPTFSETSDDSDDDYMYNSDWFPDDFDDYGFHYYEYGYGYNADYFM